MTEVEIKLDDGNSSLFLSINDESYLTKIHYKEKEGKGVGLHEIPSNFSLTKLAKELTFMDDIKFESQ